MKNSPTNKPADENGKAGKPKTTREQLKKMPNVPCLYRHEGTGEYYGVKKHLGKIKTNAFQVSDRKLAEAKLKAWVEELEAVTGGVIRLTDLCDLWLKANSDKKPKTIEGYASSVKLTKERFPKECVHEIKVSDLCLFLVDLKKRYKPSSFNHRAGEIRSIFQLAVDDRYISKNPFEFIGKKLQWQKVVQQTRTIPTEEEFKRIVHHIRTQRWSDTREEAADLAEFMSYAALGTAECYRLDFQDIDFELKEIREIRKKTGREFEVPFYPWLEDWLIAFLAKRGNPTKGKVFSVRCIKESLKNACMKLKLPRFSPRDLRKLGIERVSRAGISIEVAAKGQGHKNTILLQKVYRDVHSADTRAFRDAEMAKARKAMQERKAA